MNFPLITILALQSNDAIAQAVGSGSTLQPDLSTYTGLLGTFARMFLVFIQFYGALFHSYGLAIIATCLTLRLLLLGLTRMQIQGMKLMQALQPVQKAITRYYPNKSDQNAKMMELYSQYKISPLAGCLPMLIQMPILFGVYRALYDATFAGHSFFGVQLLFPVNLTAMHNLGLGPDCADVIDVTIAELGLHDQIWHIPATVPLIGGSYWYLPALFLVALYAASSILMQRVMKKVNSPDPQFTAEFAEEVKVSGGEGPPDMAAQMQKQMGFMNVMIILIAFILSSGAMIYFVIQNLLMSVEYLVIGKMVKVHFDAKEMKHFIKQPPPPLPQYGKPKQSAGSSSPPSPAGNDGPGQERGSGGTPRKDDMLSSPSGKSKKKRKK